MIFKIVVDEVVNDIVRRCATCYDLSQIVLLVSLRFLNVYIPVQMGTEVDQEIVSRP